LEINKSDLSVITHLKQRTLEQNPYQQYISTSLSADKIAAAEGRVAWQSPSNIAIVKYWGKYGLQLPRNPSISLTLKAARSETSIRFQTKKEKGLHFQFLFEGKPQPLFGDKLGKYLHALLPYFPFLDYLEMEIESQNTFPHSSGIASSASAMSALVMCLLEMEQLLGGVKLAPADFLQKASYLARLGSGSAARSVFPLASSWGSSKAITGSSNYYATPLQGELHEVFRTYRDSILIISKETKKVSSRAGHALMEDNPFALVRYALAQANTEALHQALQLGDQESFCRIAEAEALQLHALMMTSNPSFMLMEAATVSAIKAVQAYRAESGIPLCFTLDAGPNLHLLYPQQDEGKVKDFMQAELLQYCQQGFWIDDQVGEGPSKI
jgi:diphosphomevalonate decarboxylase